MTSFNAAANDIYIPAFVDIAKALNASPDSVSGTYGTFLFGLALAMLFVGPLSDVVGRKPMIVGGLLIFIAASFACSFATNVEALAFFRILQGLGVSSAIALSRAIVTDLFDLDRSARLLSLTAGISAIAPFVAPFAGVAALFYFGRQSIFVIVGLIGIAGLAMYWFGIPETHPPTPGQTEFAKPVGRAFKAYGQVFKDPHSIGLVLCIAGSTGGLFAIISRLKFIVADFGYGQGIFLALFFGCVLVFFLMATFNAHLVSRVGPLNSARFGAVLGVGSGVWLVFGAYTGFGGPIFLAIPCMTVVGIVGFTAPTCIAMLANRHKQSGGMSAAAALATQYGFGAILIMSIGLLPGSAPEALSSAVLASEIICLVAIFLLARHLSTPKPALSTP